MEIALIGALKPLAELGILAVLVPLFGYMLWAILKAHEKERRDWHTAHKEDSELTRATVDKNTTAIENLSNALLLRAQSFEETIKPAPKKRKTTKKK